MDWGNLYAGGRSDSSLATRVVTMSCGAVASRLPFYGAPAETIGVFTGIILQRKLALAQRIPILKDGLRQTVMEATHLAMDEQVTILD